MLIRLTSVEAFDKVLQILTQDPSFDKEINATFFRYCVDSIKNGIAKGDDEYYLSVEWTASACDKLIMQIQPCRRSGVMTDVEYLSNNGKANENN